MLLFIFFCIGIYTFSRGLKIYREIAILKSTPVLPIRNLPLGFARIRGKASGDRLVSGPVLKTACHFYWVLIETFSKRLDSAKFSVGIRSACWPGGGWIVRWPDRSNGPSASS
jgi:hypothetical protein